MKQIISDSFHKELTVENIINANQYIFPKTNLVTFGVIFFFFFDGILSQFGKSSNVEVADFSMLLLLCNVMF